MAHYALLNQDNVVVNVIVGRDETEVVDGVSDWEQHYSEQTNCKVKRTSINTVNGVHINGGTPFRGNMAMIGGVYNEELDIFEPLLLDNQLTLPDEFVD
jgi:hypothetical protein